MQEDKNNYRRRAVSFVVSCCIIIAFYFCVQRNTGLARVVADIIRVFQPLIIGFVMAFLTNPIMETFQRWLKKPIYRICKDEKNAYKTNRAVSSVLALIVLIGVCAIFIAAVVPELIDTIIYLVNNIDKQIAGVLDWCNEITGGRYEEALMNAKDSEIDDALDKGLEMAQKYLNYDRDQLVDLVTSSIISVGKLAINLIIGMFVSVYVLVSKETFKGQLKKIVCGTFKPAHANIILEVSRKSGDIFYGFIIGKLIDSIIIGIICYISCLIMKMPYAVLVSVIIGVTNIIPVFGPYIGAVPTVIIIFLTEPMKGIYFLIFVIILQQVDGNLIGPKILGNSIGVSSFWVVFAVVVGGGLFGLPGMVIGVPVVAIIYYLIGRHSKYMLRRRNLPESTKEYVDMDHIDVENNTLVKYKIEEEVSEHKKLFKKKK